jgi:hypothetical protein
MGQHVDDWGYTGPTGVVSFEPTLLDHARIIYFNNVTQGYLLPMLTENPRSIDGSPFNAPTTSSSSGPAMLPTVSMAYIHPPPADLPETDSTSASGSDSASDLAEQPDFYFTPGHKERRASLKALHMSGAVSRPMTRSQMQSNTHPAPQMTSSLTRLPGRTVASSSKGNVAQVGPRQTSRRDRNNKIPKSSTKAIGKRKMEKVNSHLEFELSGADRDNSPR